MIKKILVTTIALIILAFFAAGNLFAADFHPTRLLVRLESSITQNSLAKMAGDIDAISIAPLINVNRQSLTGDGFGANVFVMQFADSNSCAAALAQLKATPGVVYAEPDYYMQLFSDPLLSHQWGLANNGQEYFGIVRVAGIGNDTLKLMTGTPGAEIHRREALTHPTDHSRVKVAIIDTGVDYEHPDLAGNIWINTVEENGRTGFDDDFNGYIDDVRGYDFSGDDVTGLAITPDPDPMDTIGHGTHVSGIVGAVAGNGIGIEGIAPNVEIMCLKIFPNALASASALAIAYAVEHGAKVINASWGSPYFSSILFDAVKYAVDNGVVFVAASGNSGTSAPFFPARLDNAFTVGATGSDDRVTTFSTYGNWLDICAPGQDILSLRAQNTDLYAASGEPLLRIIDNDYYLADGTSMAAPHIAGCAALILSVAPGLSVDSVKNLIMNTADIAANPNGAMPAEYSPYGGWGRVNVGRAVGLLANDYAEIESPHPNAIAAGLLPISGSAFSAEGNDFILRARPASLDDWVTIASGDASIIRSVLATWDSSPCDGDTKLELAVGDGIAFTSTIRLVNSQVVEILSPIENDTVYSVADVVGSASIPTFDHYELSFYYDSDPKRKFLIARSNELIYRKSLAEWTVGQLLPGAGVLELVVFGSGDPITTTRHITIKSAIADNYPRNPGVRPHYCSTAGDIDGDGRPEILTGSRAGIIVNGFRDNTFRMISNPADSSYESAIALYDFNSDGADEIVCVTDSGISLLDGDGRAFPGWPKRVATGLQYNAFPTPLVTDIDGDSLMEILFVNAAGEIYCWHADGTSYFNSQGGRFAEVENHGLHRTFGGAFVSLLFAYDFDADGYQDVGTLYTSFGEEGGAYMFSGKNGAPLYPDRGAKVFSGGGIFGGALADFDGDGVPEIAFSHWYSANLAMATRIIEADGSELPGWPKLFPEKIQYLTPYPAAADLDKDSLPELVCVYSALDGGEVYIWRGNGEPFLGSEFGRNDGFFAGVVNSLANPIILDVDNDGELEIVSRGGAVFFGKPERLFAWNLDASMVPGWPIYTYADPSIVLYSPNTPVAGDFDGDGLLELYMGASDTKLYAWDLPTPATDGAVAWGNFLRDNRHSATLPFVARPTPAPPPLPTAFRLGQNYPNPFNQTTIIELDLPHTGKITLDVLNILGQKVATIADREFFAGFQRISWDGKDQRGDDLASGVYFYRLRMENFSQTRRMVILK